MSSSRARKNPSEPTYELGCPFDSVQTTTGHQFFIHPTINWLNYLYRNSLTEPGIQIAYTTVHCNVPTRVNSIDPHSRTRFRVLGNRKQSSCFYKLPKMLPV